MNKFEQVSSDGHQMSLAGAGPGEIPCYVVVMGGIGRWRDPVQ